MAIRAGDTAISLTSPRVLYLSSIVQAARDQCGESRCGSTRLLPISSILLNQVCSHL